MFDTLGELTILSILLNQRVTFGATLMMLFCCCSVLAQSMPTVSGSAEQTFAQFGSSIYQIRIINLKSQNLNSSGSGFYVGDSNHLATNYHVVSSVVLEPSEYKIVIEKNGEEIELQLAAIDVVNDLALLHIPVAGAPLQLREKTPAQGEKLFSVGNPHNIGMTIVEGNYNGLANDYIFDRIHFSGALNPGMSGGPTIDSKGRVVGVNVQTGGNQVGFLVPVEKLVSLLSSEQTPSVNITGDSDSDARAPKPLNNPWHAVITDQVASATSELIDAINAMPWPRESLAGAMVAGKIGPGFQCWGQSDKDKKKKVLKVNKGCNSRQSIYISDELTTGYFEYEFRALEGEKWPSGAFYTYATSEFSRGRASNQAGEKDVDNFRCVNEMVKRPDGSMRRRAAFCSRAYKKYPGLFDVFYMGATLDKTHKVLMEHFYLSGVTEEKSKAFMRRFIQQVEWQ